MRDLRAPQSCQPPPTPAIVEDVMRPQVTTVEAGAHVAAAAYLMNHAGATALMIRDGRTDQPIGIITQADIARAIARGEDANSARVHDVMTTRPAVISTTTSVSDAAQVMAIGRFRHLPVVADGNGPVGIVDLTDVCRALTDPEVVSQLHMAGAAEPG